MTNTDRIALLESTLERQLHWIGAADSKMAYGFTVNTAMLGVLAAMAPEKALAFTTAQAVSVSFAVVFGVAGQLFLSFAAFPRTEGPKGSLLFFGGIAQRSAKQYLDAVRSLSEDSYIEDLADQCHRNAEIAQKKLLWVQRALTAIYISVLPWVLSLWLLYN